MEMSLDLTKEYALVLEGGGAKGAYQIGAWRALKEAGVKICALAGSSVGALNAALICMGDLEAAENIWKNISNSQVMEVDEEKMAQLFGGNAKLSDWVQAVVKYTSDGGADITPLKELIAGAIDEQRIKTGEIMFYLHTFSLSEMKELDIDVKEIEDGLLPDFLLASAYLPVFKREKLHGKSYMDPGIINNVPLDSLIKRDYKNIIVLRIFGIGRNKPIEIPEDVNIYSVEPRVNLGNILNFDAKKSSNNMKIGYFDTQRMLYQLSGKIYYIDESQKECYYVRQLTNIDETVMEFVNSIYAPKSTKPTYRAYVEDTLGIIAEVLKLRKYDYRTLYLSILEATAKLFKVPKYSIYTVEELIDSIGEKEEREGLPAFVYVILNKLPEKTVEEEPDA
ncbi:MAG: patatin-like phospholipase family protein [Lachnospiraceae bacterium]|nr:patatin-like phospholipase family protein [Lachnospiraceae bacterium]